MRYLFDSFQFDAHNSQLAGPDGDIALRPMTVLVLQHLLENAQRVVGHEELLDAVWGRQAVSIGVLSQSIRELRQALGDSARHPVFIETKHKLGYRFLVLPTQVADVGHVQKNAIAPAGSNPGPGTEPASVVAMGQNHRSWAGIGLASLIVLMSLGLVLGKRPWTDDRAGHPSDLGAVEILREGRPQEPEALTWYWQGMDALHLADLLEARDLFERVLKREPESKAAMAGLAYALAQSGELTQARAWSEQALAGAGSLPRTAQLRLEAFAADLDYRRTEAISALQALYQLDRGDSNAGFGLVEALVGAGRINDAAEVLEGLSASPSPSLDRSRLALSQARLAGIRSNQEGRLAAAREAERLANNASAEVDALLEQARAQLLLGNLDDCRMALEAVDTHLAAMPWPAAALQRQMISGTLLREEGKFAEAIVVFDEVAARANALGQHIAEMAAIREAAFVLTSTGDSAQAIARIDGTLDVLERRGDPRQLASMLDVLSIAQQRAGDAEPAQDSARRALQAYLATGDLAGEAAARNNLGMLLARSGRAAEAQEEWEKASELFVRGADRRGEAMARSNLAILYARAGRLDAAREASEVALAAFRDIGATLDVARLQFNLGVQDRRAGRLNDAQSRFREALESFTAMGAGDFRLQVIASLGELLLLRADLSAAAALLAEVELGDSFPPQRRAAIETARAHHAALSGENETANAGFRSARLLRDGAGLKDWVRMSDLDLAELAARQGHLGVAEQASRELRRGMLEADDAHAALQAGILLAGTLSAQGRVEQAERMLDDLEKELIDNPDALLTLRVDLLRASLRRDLKAPALLRVASRAREAGFELLALRAELLAEGPESARAREELDRRGVRVDGMPPPIPY